MKKILFFLLLITFQQKALTKEITYFHCPINWAAANPKNYPKYIKISFVENKKSVCKPSLNLAIEPTSLNLDDYAAEATKIYINDPKTNYQMLEKIPLKQGKAFLCKINKNVNKVDFEMLQMIFIKNNIAYVLTGACKKNDMIENYRLFMKAFLTFETTDDIFSLINDEMKKEELKKLISNLDKNLKGSNKAQKQKNLISFEKFLDKKFENLGKYFQVLLLEYILKKI